jgi:hypothetical protein
MASPTNRRLLTTDWMLELSNNLYSKYFVNLFLLTIPILCTTGLRGQSITEPSGVTIGVASDGTFTIRSAELVWSYSGSTSGRVIDITGPVRGSDNNQGSTNGPFDEFTVDYIDPDGNPWRVSLLTLGHHFV